MAPEHAAETATTDLGKAPEPAAQTQNGLKMNLQPKRAPHSKSQLQLRI